MGPQALAAVATLLSFAPHGNRIELRLDHGSAEMVWLSNSTFHFRRSLDGPLAAASPEKINEPVAVHVDDTPGALRVTSAYLDVTIQKHGLLLRVRKADGTQLSADLSEPRADETGVVWERSMAPGARFYGLGPSTSPTLDLRGTAVNAEMPFLISSAGFGEYHVGSGPFRFDFTGADRYRVESPRVDYYFYYGPTTKEIFKERNAVGPPAHPWRAPASVMEWNGLRDSLLMLVHAAMSGVLEPGFDLSPYNPAAPLLQQRARQIGSLAPGVTAGTVGLSGFRKQLDAFFAAYVPEIEYHGYPMWHPLPFQFSDDPECGRHADEFMLGDEMLVAPIVDTTGKRSLYLPQGIWTNLETNEVSPGRRTVSVETQSLPVFARNGTIVPLAAANGMALHYFPKLGAEFFFLEEDLGEYSQVHAAPAADIMRLEIESRKERDYQWVVHHIDKPVEVAFENTLYRQVQSLKEMADHTWFYDAPQKNLQVRVHAKANEDCIINLSW
jgi:alpha-glucosidase (family GH31 glycosyl hydrolase)